MLPGGCECGQNIHVSRLITHDVKECNDGIVGFAQDGRYGYHHEGKEDSDVQALKNCSLFCLATLIMSADISIPVTS